MTIRNPDGTPYALTGSIQQFDPSNPMHNLFNVWDQEAIMQGGSPLLYYEVFIDFNSIDELYLEARGKVWSPVYQTIWGYYEPIEPQNPSTGFGIDGPGDVMFECNTRAVLQTIGHQPKRGSIIHTPHMNEDWVIVDIRLSQFQMWGALHVQMICERYQGSPTTTGEASLSRPKPTYTIF